MPKPSSFSLVEDPEEAARVRRLDCRTYGSCLLTAWRSGWPGFSCRGCSAYSAMTHYEKRRDLEGLARFTAALISGKGERDGGARHPRRT